MTDCPEGNTCPVCNGELHKDTVSCVACATRHHPECWNLIGQCSTYGCGSTIKGKELVQSVDFVKEYVAPVFKQLEVLTTDPTERKTFRTRYDAAVYGILNPPIVHQQLQQALEEKISCYRTELDKRCNPEVLRQLRDGDLEQLVQIDKEELKRTLSGVKGVLNIAIDVDKTCGGYLQERHDTLKRAWIHLGAMVGGGGVIIASIFCLPLPLLFVSAAAVTFVEGVNLGNCLDQLRNQLSADPPYILGRVQEPLQILYPQSPDPKYLPHAADSGK